MTDQELRDLETYAIGCPLEFIEDPDMLAYVASLIVDNDHLREKLLTEPDGRKRSEKLDAMRPHLKFRANSLSTYELAEQARAQGVQPIYEEQQKAEQSRIWMPPSFVHEVSR